MKIEKINIQTSNNKHATDIAMLIDKPEFIKELIRLREKWEVTELYSLPNIHEQLIEKVDLKGKNNEFNDDIDELLKKFNRGRNFKKVIEYALLTGIVPEGIYLSCYFDVATIGELEDLSKPEKYQYIIVMSPRTEKQEVEQAYKEFQEYLTGYEATNEFETDILGKINFLKRTQNLDIENPNDRELIDQYHKGNVYETADITKFKSKTDIDRVREWYWIRNEKYFNGEISKPLSYPEVLDEWLDTCPRYKNGETHDANDAECPKCTFYRKRIRNDKRIKDGGGSYNHIEKALSAYATLLNNS